MSRRRTILTLIAVWLMANVAAWFGPAAWRRMSIRLDQQGRPGMLQYYTRHRFQCASTDGAPFALPYLLFTPSSRQSTSYPLVVVLHGAGERGDDLQSHLGTLGNFLVVPDGQRRHPCVVAAPQCPTRLSWNSRHPVDMAGVVNALVAEIVGRAQVDPTRVYLIGHSMGGYGCWHVAATAPERFAAMLPVAGGGDPAAAEHLAGVPVWAIHGQADRVVPCERSRQMVEAVKAQGGEARLTVLPEVGHDSWRFVQETPNEYLDWLFSQRSEP